MSRGFGRVERLIVAMFTANPGAVFSAADLAMSAYPAVGVIRSGIEWPFAGR